MINAFIHTPTGAQVQFPAPPLRSGKESIHRVQSKGYDSEGDIYVYNRNASQRHISGLTFTQVSQVELDKLRTFLQSRNGDKMPFSWFDHTGVDHTVRFTDGSLHYKETSPGKYQIEVALEETPTNATLITGIETDWNAVSARQINITPIWIIRTLFEDVARDISDSAWQFPIGSLNGFTTTLPLISAWGQLHENISGTIGEMLVADFSTTMLVDQDDDNNIRHLALRDALERNPVELYLTFAELDPTIVAPRLMFRGNVKDVEIADETQVYLNNEDETAKLQRYLGTKITSEAFPLCDPDIVGKLIPIVLGTVSKLPALCVDSGWVSSLPNDLDATSTTMVVSEIPAYSLANRYIWVEEEIVLCTAQAGTTLSIIRGQTGTLSALHVKGSIVIEKKSTPLVYLLAAHPLDSIGAINAVVRGVNVDITSDCTKYLGTSGNQLPAYPGQAAITIPDVVRVSQRISLALAGDITSIDPGHSHNSGNVTSNASIDQDATNTGAGLFSGSASWDATHNKSSFPASQGFVVKTVTFANPPAVPFSGTMTATVTAHLPTTGGYWYLSCGGKAITLLYSNGIDNWSPPITLDATSVKGNIVSLVIVAYATGQNASLTAYGEGTITACHRKVNYSSTQIVTITPAGTGLTLNNTLGLTGNSVADIAIGSAVLVDCVKTFASVQDQFNFLLTTYCNDTTLVQVGTLPDFYLLNGAITEYKRTIEWLDYLAFQSKCWFRRIKGVSKLIVRHATPVNPTVIPTCCLTSEGIRDLSYKKAPITDVINIINILYDRDWSKTGNAAELYQRSQSSTNADSIANYGPLEQPNMFMFDFVIYQGMAADLANFFHDFFSVRKWFVSYSNYLDQVGLEFADEVQLAFAQDLTGIIIEAGLQPGSLNQMDIIRFTAAVTHLPPEILNAVTTLLGDYIHTKDGEVMTYV